MSIAYELTKHSDNDILADIPIECCLLTSQSHFFGRGLVLWMMHLIVTHFLLHTDSIMTQLTPPAHTNSIMTQLTPPAHTNSIMTQLTPPAHTNSIMTQTHPSCTH